MTQKRAFSYLELIISMALVTVIIIISSPFLATVSKNTSTPYGEFICYAKYVNGSWKLFQNERINSPSFPLEDKDVTSEGCTFKMPNGNVPSYTITLYGGGGSGSAPYFNYADSSAIHIAKGQDGQKSRENTETDSLSGSFKDGKIIIKFCDDNAKDTFNIPIGTCIGKGGEKNETYNTSYTKKEKLTSILRNLSEGTLFPSDENELRSIGNNDINGAIDNAKTTNSYTSLASKIKGLLSSSSIIEKGYNTGHSGQETQIILSNGKRFFAKGGSFGVSDKNQDSSAFNKNSMTTDKDKEIYWTPEDEKRGNPTTTTGNPSNLSSCLSSCNSRYSASSCSNTRSSCYSASNSRYSSCVSNCNYYQTNYNSCISSCTHTTCTTNCTSSGICTQRCTTSSSNCNRCSEYHSRYLNCKNNCAQQQTERNKICNSNYSSCYSRYNQNIKSCKNQCYENYASRYQNCDGLNAINYGEGGKAGVFVCKLKDVNNDYSSVGLVEENLNQIQDKKCYCGKGGIGAGGAIIIKWN